MENKLCPLKMIYKGSNYKGLWECEKEKCAWWDMPSAECAVLSIANQLKHIEDELYLGGKNGK